MENIDNIFEIFNQMIESNGSQSNSTKQPAIKHQSRQNQHLKQSRQIYNDRQSKQIYNDSLFQDPLEDILTKEDQKVHLDVSEFISNAAQKRESGIYDAIVDQQGNFIVVDQRCSRLLEIDLNKKNKNLKDVMIGFSYDYLQNMLNNNCSDSLDFSFLINSESSYKKVNTLLNKKISRAQDQLQEDPKLDFKSKKQEQLFEKYSRNTNFNSLHIFYKFYKNIDCRLRFMDIRLQNGVLDTLKDQGYIVSRNSKDYMNQLFRGCVVSFQQSSVVPDLDYFYISEYDSNDYFVRKRLQKLQNKIRILNSSKNKEISFR